MTWSSLCQLHCCTSFSFWALIKMQAPPCWWVSIIICVGGCLDLSDPCVSQCVPPSQHSSPRPFNHNLTLQFFFFVVCQMSVFWELSPPLMFFSSKLKKKIECKRLCSSPRPETVQQLQKAMVAAQLFSRLFFCLSRVTVKCTSLWVSLVYPSIMSHLFLHFNVLLPSFYSQNNKGKIN